MEIILQLCKYIAAFLIIKKKNIVRLKFNNQIMIFISEIISCLTYKHMNWKDMSNTYKFRGILETYKF